MQKGRGRFRIHSQGRRRFLRIAGLVLFFGIAVTAMFASLQRHLIYRPATSPRVSVHDDPDLLQFYPDATDVRLTTDDGVQIGGWYLRAPGNSETANRDRLLVLYFHGNAGHRGHRLPWYHVFRRLEADVLAPDYRGYGDSEGSPSEAGLKRDAAAAWRYATEELGYVPGRICLIGSSLGGAVAVHTAAELSRRGMPPAGLVGVGTFSSMTDVACSHYPWLPVRLLLLDRYSSRTEIADATCPYLHIHGDQDDVVSLSLGRRLFDAAPDASASGCPKHLVVLSGTGHNDVVPDEAATVKRELSAFFARIASHDQDP